MERSIWKTVAYFSFYRMGRTGRTGRAGYAEPFGAFVLKFHKNDLKMKWRAQKRWQWYGIRNANFVYSVAVKKEWDKMNSDNNNKNKQFMYIFVTNGLLFFSLPINGKGHAILFFLAQTQPELSNSRQIDIVWLVAWPLITFYERLYPHRSERAVYSTWSSSDYQVLFVQNIFKLFSIIFIYWFP